MAERTPKAKILMTRSDHLAVGSSPPIGPEFGDDVPLGDTLSDEQLIDRYSRDIAGIEAILGLPLSEAERNRQFGGFLDTWKETLKYYEQRGVNIKVGSALLNRLNLT